MARGINKVILIGNLGKDPETRYMPSGGAVTNLTLATSETWKDKQTGQPQERTEWHRVVFFNRLAEIAAEYLKKAARYILRALSEPASGRTRAVRTNTPLKSWRMKCRCWIVVAGQARAHQATTIACSSKAHQVAATANPSNNNHRGLAITTTAQTPDSTVLTMTSRSDKPTESNKKARFYAGFFMPLNRCLQGTSQC